MQETHHLLVYGDKLIEQKYTCNKENTQARLVTNKAILHINTEETICLSQEQNKGQNEIVTIPLTNENCMHTEIRSWLN
jgi:hypothetical protein